MRAAWKEARAALWASISRSSSLRLAPPQFRGSGALPLMWVGPDSLIVSDGPSSSVVELESRLFLLTVPALGSGPSEIPYCISPYLRCYGASWRLSSTGYAGRHQRRQTSHLANFRNPQESRSSSVFVGPVIAPPEGVLSAVSSRGRAGVSPSAPGIGGIRAISTSLYERASFPTEVSGDATRGVTSPGVEANEDRTDSLLVLKRGVSLCWVSALRSVVACRPRVERSEYRGMREAWVSFKMLVLEGMFKYWG